MSRLALILLLSLPSAHLFAADAKWVHATSEHFDMYATQSEADARAALLHLEAVRAYFVAATHSRDPGGQPVRIVVFQSAGDFNKYKPEEYVGASAFPIAGQPAVVVALGLKPENYEKIFLEYCQLVMDESAPKVPYWLRAGLAQFYSTLKPGENTMKLGGAPSRAFHTHASSDIDINQLVGVDKSGYLASRMKVANDFYDDTSNNAALGGKGAAATTAMNAVQTKLSQDYEGEVWTLTHMMMFTPEYRAKMGEFIGALGSGQETGTALSTVFGKSLGQVRADLMLYMKQGSLAVATVKFPYEKPAAPVVKPVTKDEEDRVLVGLNKKEK